MKKNRCLPLGNFWRKRKINFYQWVIFFSPRGIDFTMVSYFPATLGIVIGHVFYDLTNMSFSAEASCLGHSNFWVATNLRILQSRYICMKCSYRPYSELTNIVSPFCLFSGGQPLWWSSRWLRILAFSLAPHSALSWLLYKPMTHRESHLPPCLPFLWLFTVSSWLLHKLMTHRESYLPYPCF